jgi:hypothetical protein
MDKQLKTVWQFIKANPVTMACLAVAVIITVSTIAYSRNHSTSLQRKQVESEAKLAQAIDSSKKVKSEREKAEQAAAVAAAEAAKKKTTTTTDKKKTEEKTYESVPVNVSVGSGQVAASVGSAKPGTCYYMFKNTNVDPYEKSEASVSASNGTCQAVTIPAGSWTKVYVSYKASDYSAKGDGYHVF